MDPGNERLLGTRGISFPTLTSLSLALESKRFCSEFQRNSIKSGRRSPLSPFCPEQAQTLLPVRGASEEAG